MSGHVRALARDADAVVQPVRTGWHGDALPGAMILGWQRTIGADGVGRDLVVITIVSILDLNETIPLSLLQ
jgi:hypothetical protein